MTTDLQHANGHALVPLRLPERGPVAGVPQQDDPGQSRTVPDKDERRRRPDGTAFIVVALAVVAVVAVIAFSASYQHQYELDIFYRQTHWVAALLPLTVDGLIVAAGLTIWCAARYGYGRPVGAYLALFAGVGATVVTNLAADQRYHWPWVGPGISVWPAAAFVAAYEMAVWLVRKRQDSTGDVQPDCPRCGHPGHPRTPMECERCPEGYCESRCRVDKRPDSPQDKPAGKVDKPAPRRTAVDSRTALDKAAAAIRDNPHLDKPADKAELARIAGVSAKTIQRARNGSIA